MPLSLIHCREDVAYPLEYAKEWEALLIKAGVQVTLHEVPGTHYGSVTNPVEYVYFHLFRYSIYLLDIYFILASPGSTPYYTIWLPRVTLN